MHQNSRQAAAVLLSSHPLVIYLRVLSQRRPEPLCSSLAVREEGGSSNSYILSSPTLPLVRFQELQRFCDVTMKEQKRDA